MFVKIKIAIHDESSIVTFIMSREFRIKHLWCKLKKLDSTQIITVCNLNQTNHTAVEWPIAITYAS